MADIVRLPGSTKAEEDVYLGSLRELRVVSTLPELRLHDGEQVGGHRILTVTQSDYRYQGKHADLTGLSSFGPAAMGLSVRTVAGSWSLRTIEGTAGQIEVLQGNGVEGNPKLSLALSQTASLTFTKEITFSAGMAGNVTGNLTGNVTGNLTGNITGNVTGNVTGNLTGNAEGAHAGAFTGDVDVSEGTLTLAEGQVPLSAIDASLVEVGSNLLVPSLVVLMWYGELENIPSGWVLCDGENGTPDMRDRFVIGAGNTYDADDTGGSESHTHGSQPLTTTTAGAHNHTTTVSGTTLTIDQIPAHYHSGLPVDRASGAIWGSDPSSASDEVDFNTGDAEANARTSVIGGGQPHTHSASTAAAGDHAHGLAVPTTTALPPYKALYFIMKT